MNLENTMSRPDYEQTILHHSYLLVLLRGVGPSKPRTLQKAFDKVRGVNNVKITDSNGLIRDIWVRYIHDHPVENNDWGDFQTHRRLLGLVTIGKFETQIELNELCRQHESLKVRYGGTLYESRAIFFGPPIPEEPAIASSSTAVTNHNDLETIKENPCPEIKISLPKRLQDEYTTPSNFKAQAFFYRENDLYEDLETHIVDFVNGLFWILESRRLERSREKPEKCSLLTAPFEKREVVGLDRDSRNSKKRITGRTLKNLADLSLQAGLIEDALSLYHNACETLKSIIDFLWEGAAEEGLCAASALLLYPHLRTEETLHRNASLQVGSPLKNTPEKWRSSDLTKRVTTSDKHNHEHSDILSPPPHSASTSSVSSILTNSTLSQTSSSSSSTSTSTISAAHPRGQYSELPGNILKAEEIPIYFHKAIINYSKYGYAAVVEIEASFKAARISIEQNRPLDVAMVLQNVLYINHSLTEKELIRMFEMMTALYQQVGYMRKAAFFQRLAALKHVHQSANQSDFTHTYRLMLSSFPGYMLSLDPMEVLENNSGWPSIQIDLLQSLITAARNLGQSTLATRHMTFLLQTQWHNMKPKEQSEMAVQLKNLSAQCEGSPVPLFLENGTVIPPANLTDIPYCLDFSVKDLPAHLRPQRLKIDKAESGPFLFTPLQFNSIDRRDKNKDKNKIAFCWVQNNVSEVAVRLRNPLPFEVIVNDMRLLTNGTVFKSLSQTITLQPHAPTNVTLHGTPLEVGQLDIQGYSTHTLGVKSNCRLKHMKDRKFPLNYLVNVIPALPCISVKTSLPQTATFSNLANKDLVITSASLTLYNGESSSCVITVTNESLVPIEHLELNVTSNVAQEMQQKIFVINEDDIQSKLPIAAQCSIDFKVTIFAEADFICPGIINQQATTSMHSANTLNNPSSSYDSSASLTIASGHVSLPLRGGSPNSFQQIQMQSKRNDTGYSSFRSIPSSAHQSAAALNLSPLVAGLTAINSSKPVEAQLRLKYSGGEALPEGYCRQCAISFNLEFLSSAQITSWDVLPAEIPSQFYLVLDITNLTAQEMSLNYTNHKNILIEAKESCRVPIPVDRCSLEQVYAVREAEIAENLEKELCFRSQTVSFNDSVSRLCSKHIAERVKINWLLTGTNIRGIASLKGIILTQPMIDLCTVSPLQWSILFKNQPMQPQSEIICVAGQSSILSIDVRNQSLHPLRNLTLTIKFYQDYLNGIENYSLETRVAVSGPNRVHIPILQKDQKVHHECSVLFFTPGRFKTSIQCHAKPQPIYNQSLSRSCPVPQQMSSDLQVTLNNVNIATQSYHEQQEHIWKFIPPIEVTVVDHQ